MNSYLTMEEDRNSASDSEGDGSPDESSNINDFASTLINGTANNEPETNATLSQRVFHAAKDGMALTLYALLANQARPQQVCDVNNMYEKKIIFDSYMNLH